MWSLRRVRSVFEGGWSIPLPVASLILGPFRPSRQPPWPPPPPWQHSLSTLLFFASVSGSIRVNERSVRFVGTCTNTPTFTYRIYCLQVVGLPSSTGSGPSHDYIKFTLRITLALRAGYYPALPPGTGTIYCLQYFCYQTNPLQGHFALCAGSTTARTSYICTFFSIYLLRSLVSRRQQSLYYANILVSHYHRYQLQQAKVELITEVLTSTISSPNRCLSRQLTLTPIDQDQTYPTHPIITTPQPLTIQSLTGKRRGLRSLPVLYVSGTIDSVVLKPYIIVLHHKNWTLPAPSFTLTCIGGTESLSESWRHRRARSC